MPTAAPPLQRDLPLLKNRVTWLHAPPPSTSWSASVRYASAAGQTPRSAAPLELETSCSDPRRWSQLPRAVSQSADSLGRDASWQLEDPDEGRSASKQSATESWPQKLPLDWSPADTWGPDGSWLQEGAHAESSGRGD